MANQNIYVFKFAKQVNMKYESQSAIYCTVRLSLYYLGREKKRQDINIDGQKVANFKSMCRSLCR